MTTSKKENIINGKQMNKVNTSTNIKTIFHIPVYNNRQNYEWLSINFDRIYDQRKNIILN